MWMRGATYQGQGGPAVAERASNQIAARFGIASLIGGLWFEAVISQLSAGVDDDRDAGLADTLIALGLAAFVAAALLALYLATKRWFLRRLLRHLGAGIGSEKGWNSKNARALVRVGQAAGFALKPYEAPVYYLRRVFSIEAPEGIEIDLD